MGRSIGLGGTLLLAIFATCAIPGCDPAGTHQIGILQWTEAVFPFHETHRGLVEGLTDKGYRAGANLKVLYRDAEQDLEAARKMAEDLIAGGCSPIVTLGTSSALAAREAAGSREVPIIFAIVGAPKATGLIKDYGEPGLAITGVSMEIPVAEQFGIVREALPGSRTLGILYCDELPQAVATGGAAVAASETFGWKPVVVSIPRSRIPDLPGIVSSLAAGVDALYLPTDPLLYDPRVLGGIVGACDARRVPVVTVSNECMRAGAFMAVHCDFYEVGRQAASLVDRVLSGDDVRTIPPVRPGSTGLSLNLKKARQLGLEVPRNVILKAWDIVD
jgi:putative tryptophan/tyrosine transport system substrate-binding protein